MTRISAIDSARGMAVFLAMLGHATSRFALNIDGAETFQAIQLMFTRTATPTFMILFGIMIELVYLRKLRAGGEMDTVRFRLMSRLITCYLMFVAITVAAMITGKLTAFDTTKAVLFLGTGAFGNILQIYTVLFGVILLTLPLAVRWGSLFFLAFAAVAWGLKYIFMAIGVPNIHVIHFIFGHGTGFGPSIFLGLTLVAFGLMIGEAISGHRTKAFALVILAAAVAIMAYGLSQGDAWSYMQTVIRRFRWENQPSYYAYGIVTCSLSLLIFLALWRLIPHPSPAISFEKMGQETMFYYGFGNVFINLLPTVSDVSLFNYVYVAAFLAALTLISAYRHLFFAWMNGWSGNLPDWTSATYTRLNRGLSAMLLRPFGVGRPS